MYKLIRRSKLSNFVLAVAFVLWLLLLMLCLIGKKLFCIESSKHIYGIQFIAFMRFIRIFRSVFHFTFKIVAIIREFLSSQRNFYAFALINYLFVI